MSRVLGLELHGNDAIAVAVDELGSVLGRARVSDRDSVGAAAASALATVVAAVAMPLAGLGVAAIARDAARNGDGVAISVVRDTAKYLGMAAANLVVVVDPAVLVLGGIVAGSPDVLLELVRTELARRLPRATLDTLMIAPAKLGAEAAAIGAARLATAALQ